MPIKITCPHCKRGMLVPENLAGKKGRCKACQQMLTVPALPSANASATEQVPPAAPTTKPAAPPRPSADVDAEAAALFADEPKPVEPVEVKTIDLNCPFCDEPIQLPAELAGKRAPCPECKHIIKVPELVKKDPKDWRKVEARGPSGARLPDQPAPEGAWSSTATSAVGKQSLVEAGVIPVTTPPRTLWQKVRWPLLGAGLVLLLGVGGWQGYRWWGQRAAGRMLQEALAFASSPEAQPPTQAALSMAAGEYYLRTRTDRPAVNANNQFGKAFTTLRAASKGEERDALLADLALAQVELGGDKAEIDKDRAIPWEKTQQLLLASLREIHHAEARSQALRAVSQRLLERGQSARVLPLTHQVYAAGDAEQTADKAAALAVIGLEFLKANDRASAEKAADEALQLYPKDAKPPTPLRAEVVALALVLDKKNVPPAGEEAEDKGNEHIGKVEALARKGEWEAARKQAAKDELGEVVQFRARLAVAAAAVDAKLSDAEDIEAVLKTAEGKVGGKPELSWSMLRLIQLVLQTSVPAERVQTVADKIGSSALRGRAQLAVFRARLAPSKQAVEESAADKIDANSLARALAAQELARHNTHWGANYGSVVQSWPQPRKAFGSLGIVLGLQDRER
jgi:hypothetical protein